MQSKEARRFVTDNIVGGAGSILAGILGFLLQAAITHSLHRQQYGAVFAIVSLIGLLTPGGAFTTLMSWNASGDLARSGARTAASAALLKSATNRLLIVGIILALIMCILSPMIGGFLHVPISWVVFGALSAPFGMATPLLVGELQGEQRFGAWATVVAGLAGVKLVLAVILGALFGAGGVLIGLSLASALIFAGALVLVRKALARAEGRPDWGAAGQFLVRTLPANLAITVLLSADVVLVKHLFAPPDAGQYAAVAALGRSTFWAMAGVGGVLFPKVASRAAVGQSITRVVLASVALAGSIGLFGVLVFSFAGREVLQLFAGHNYVDGAAFLGWYSLAMVFWGASVVMINTHQARGRGRLMIVLAPAIILEPTLIWIAHGSLIQVTQMLDIAMGLLFVALTIFTAVDSSRGQFWLDGSRRRTQEREVGPPEPMPIRSG
jgi:O-antigen/teichoic acid export membrane protein